MSKTIIDTGVPEPVAADSQPSSFINRLHHQNLSSLPAEPITVIQPSGTWGALDLNELWTYRELIFFLTWRDLKVRYKQTLLGASWVVLQPLMMTLVFTVFLGMLVRVPSQGLPYPLFVYCGLLIWTFFSASVSSSSNSLIASSHLITKVYFPRLGVPLSAILGRLVDLGMAFVILIGMLIYYRVGLKWNILMAPALVSLAMLLALGAGVLLSALNVKYRDVGMMLPVVIQLWMYASPVVYPSTLVPSRWRMLYELNPLAGIVEGFRTSVFGGAFNWRALAVSLAFTFLLLIIALFIFRRVEKEFADVI
jgi:lipopolysaccharide transport system permease protein